MHTTNLHRNVHYLRRHAMFAELSFLIPTIIAFAAWRGVSFSQFMAIQGLFSVAMLVLTPLVSPLADKYGRRPAAIVGSVFWLLGHLVIWLGYGWQSYAAAEVLLGLGIAAFKPAAEALLYDSLASVNRKDAHYTALTRQNRALSYAGAIAMACGGWMFTLHATLPVIATLMSNVAMVVMAWHLKEVPYQTSISAKTPSYRSMWHQVWVSLSAPQTRWLVILPGLITGSTITLFWSLQPTLTGAGIGATVTSLLLTGHFFMRGLFAGWCPALAQKLTGRQCFLLCITALGVGFAAMAFCPWWLAYPAFIFGAGFAYILADTLGRELVHRHVASDVRSTALGGFGFVSRVISTITLTTCSVLQPWLGLPVTLAVIGGVAVIICLASLTRLPGETDQPTSTPETQAA